MPKLTLQLAKLRLDENGFIKTVDKNASKLVTDAAKEFFYAAVAKIPVLTGMSQGSLQPAARFVGANLPPISPKEHRAGRGVAAGEAASSYRFTFQDGIYAFEWEHSVVHFKWNDILARNYKNGQMPTPWEALATGRLASDRYIKRHVREVVPSPRKFFKLARTVKR